MNRFFRHIALFFCLLFALVFSFPLLGTYLLQQKDFNNGNTESNLLALVNERHYNYLLLGNSHARNFSRYNQHAYLEKELGGTVLNFGQGAGVCGVNDQLFYLKFLLQQDYSFDHIIHVVSPPYLYKRNLNEVTITFQNEPFSFPFFLNYLFHPAPQKTERLFTYLRSKWNVKWLSQEPEADTINGKFLEKRSSDEIAEGLQLAYPFGAQEADFLENIKYLEASINLAEKNGIKFSLLETPQIIGDWPGEERFNSYCDSLSKAKQLKFINLSDSIAAPVYYYDHHHLNTKGLRMITPMLKAALRSIQ